MIDPTSALLSHADVRVSSPAQERDIEALTARLGTDLPAQLVTLWRHSDGLDMDSINARILGPSEVISVIDGEYWNQDLNARGFIPILDDLEANYLTLLVRPPLAFRMAYLPHDDSSRLIYRDFHSFIRSILILLDVGLPATSFYYDAEGDYPPDTARCTEDQRAARALMATDGESEEWNHAAQLLDASNLDEWARLLETDHFVRRDVLARMRNMSSPEIEQLLRRDQKLFEEFAVSAAEAARRADLRVGQRKGENLQVDGKWMNLDAFFHRRNIPNAKVRMINWFKDLLADRDPHDRPGHFMED